MLEVAKFIEEPLRSLITLLGAIFGVVIIPWVTDIEGRLIARMDYMEPATSHMVYYILGIILTLVLCGVVGYYLGKLVTWPIRRYIHKHERLEWEAQLKKKARYQ